MGRTESAIRLPEEDVIDRASRLLAGAAGVGPWAQGRAGPAPGPAPIVLDEMTAGLLDARFDVEEREGSLVLRGEHALMQGRGRCSGGRRRTWGATGSWVR